MAQRPPHHGTGRGGWSEGQPPAKVSNLCLGPGGPRLSGVQVPSKGTVVPGLGSKSQGHFRPVRLASGIRRGVS